MAAEEKPGNFNCNSGISRVGGNKAPGNIAAHEVLLKWAKDVGELLERLKTGVEVLRRHRSFRIAEFVGSFPKSGKQLVPGTGDEGGVFDACKPVRGTAPFSDGVTRRKRRMKWWKRRFRVSQMCA